MTARTAGGGADAPGRPAVNPYLVALTVTLATFMEVLDTSIANVSLPHIAGNLSATVDESTWVLTSYLVSNAIILPLNGWFSSMLGRKRFYMLCVMLFTVSSALCGLAPNLGMLIFFRVLQGLGGGGLQPSEQAILYDTFPPQKRGIGMALYGIAVVTAPIIGPTLGGWITDNFSWRWIFFINIPVGLVSLFLTSRLVHDPSFRKRRDLSRGFKLDYIGLGLIAVGLGALQVVLYRGQMDDWFSSRFIMAFALIAGAALAAAIVWSLLRRDPLVDIRLLGERNFMLSNAAMFMLGFILFGSTLLLPLYLQTLMGYTATESGMALSPGGLVTMASMPLVGFLVGRVQARWLVVIGVGAASYALYLMSSFNLSIDFRTAAAARMVLGFGLAFLFVPVNTQAFSFIAREKANNAAGLLNLARNLGGSAGIAFVTTIVQRHAQSHQQTLAGHLSPCDPQCQSSLSDLTQYLMAQGAGAVDAALQAHAVLYQTLQQQARMLSFLDSFRLLAYLFLLVIPLMFLMKKTKPLKDAPAH